MIATNNELIKALKNNEIFVFGSNLKGEHLGGAARQAYEEFGAEWGIGEGLTGRCYAFPTLDENFYQLRPEVLLSAKRALYRCARAHPELTFLLTKVGCGIAGNSEDVMKKLFRVMPSNVVKPGGWR